MKKQEARSNKVSQEVKVLASPDVISSNSREQVRICHYCGFELEAGSTQCPDCNYPCEAVPVKSAEKSN